MLDFEPRLANLKPEIKWQGECTDKFCARTHLESQRGNITVPADYESHSATFEVGFQRVSVSGRKPRIHFIVLTGGPGGYGSNLISLANFFTASTKGEAASYLVDHRGLGASGEFVPPGKAGHEFFNKPTYYLAKAPFDVKHLSTENAALDVGMIAMAIKSSPDWMPDSRLVVYGFSYGSQWAHHSAMRLPNLYDSVILGGVHFPDGASKSSLQGVADNCAMDAFCRKKMGGNVEQTYRKTVRNILKPDYNECTALFHKTFSIINTQPPGENIRVLVNMLSRLVLGFNKDFKDSREHRSVMAVLPILKATSDCLDVKEYQKKILIPLTKYCKDFQTNTDEKKDPDDNINIAVNSLTILNGWCCLTGSNIPPASPDHSDLHPSILTPLYYHDKYQALEKYLRGRKCTVSTPAKTTKTAFYIAQSKMDVRTPVLPGWELYQKIEAPSKSWLLFDHRSHDGYVGDCMRRFILEALYGSTDSDYEACMRGENAARKLDWTLKDAPDFRNIWDLVADEGDMIPIITHLPTYTKGSCPVSEPIIRIVPIPEPKKPATGMWVIIALAVVAAIFLYFLYKKYRSKPQEQAISA